MNTIELLDNIRPIMIINGFYVDMSAPTEFILNVMKDLGAERWKFYGTKESFAVILGDSGKPQVISVCPMKDAVKYMTTILEKVDGSEKLLAGFNKFLEKSSELPIPKNEERYEERYYQSMVEFLDGKKERTLSVDEINTTVNNFRVKSGWEPTFKIESNITNVKDNINTIRDNLNKSDKTSTLKIV